MSGIQSSPEIMPGEYDDEMTKYDVGDPLYPRSKAE